MTTPQAPLPKRRPLRTREELVQAGRQRAEGMRPTPEPAARLATLLMMAFPVKPSRTRRRAPRPEKKGRPLVKAGTARARDRDRTARSVREDLGTPDAESPKPP